MGKITGFLEFEREKAAQGAGRRAPEALARVRGADARGAAARRRARAAWIAASPSVTRAARSGTSSPTGTTSCTAAAGSEAIERLHSTNNFPEFTGRICPAPCEEACVLNINDDPVTIKNIEKNIIDHAFAEGWVHAAGARAPHRQDGGRGRLGPRRAGVRPAARARRPRGDAVRARRPDRRPAALRHPRLQDGEVAHRPAHGADGGRGRDLPHRRRTSGVDVTGDAAAARVRRGRALERRHQAARPARARAASCAGIHFAMEFLPQQNKVVAGDRVAGQILATGKRVVILGGGDTGSDCLGTSNRHGAESVHQFELLPAAAEGPPAARLAQLADDPAHLDARTRRA